MKSTTNLPFTHVFESYDVDSSMIEHVSYIECGHSMLVYFKNGHIYQYKDVPHTIFELLVNAESVGKYFHMAIRGAYDYERVA